MAEAESNEQTIDPASAYIAKQIGKGGTVEARIEVVVAIPSGDTKTFQLTLTGQVPHPSEDNVMVPVSPLILPVSDTLANALPIGTLLALANQTQVARVEAMTAALAQAQADAQAAVAAAQQQAQAAVAAEQGKTADAKADALTLRAEIDRITTQAEQDLAAANQASAAEKQALQQSILDRDAKLSSIKALATQIASTATQAE